MTKPIPFTREQELEIEKLLKHHTIGDVAEMMGATYYQIRGVARRNNISCKLSKEDRSKSMARKTGRFAYSKEIDEFVRSIAEGSNYKDITEQVNAKMGTNYTEFQIKNFMTREGILTGTHGWFTRDDQRRKIRRKPFEPNAGCFTKGHTPSNTDPIGTEKILSDGYIWVKVDDKPCVRKQENWTPKHRLIYEREHGPIPEGGMIIFADGDKTNLNIDNLVCIDKSINGIMNKCGYRNSNPDVTKVGVNIARIQLKINEQRNSPNATDNGRVV